VELFLNNLFQFNSSVPLSLQTVTLVFKHVSFVLLIFVSQTVDDAVEVGFLFGVLEDSGHRDVGQVVGVEVDEGELEDERGEAVEVVLVLDLLGLEALVEATLAEAVVARVELE